MTRTLFTTTAARTAAETTNTTNTKRFTIRCKSTLGALVSLETAAAGVVAEAKARGNTAAGFALIMPATMGLDSTSRPALTM